ncbi:MAG: lamin tail domain-containing protein, partial [Candidatus Saccharimonadales bacterium]
MKYARVILCFVFVISQLSGLIISSDVNAVSTDGLVISHVITGESSSSNSEFVSIYNNGSTDVAVDGYCLKNKANVAFTCITAEVNTKVYIRSHGFLTFASTVFMSTHTYIPDTNYTSSNTIQVGGDSLSLIDVKGNAIDKMTWGTSGGAISSNTNGTLLRKTDPINAGMLVDTDTMTADFTSLTSLIYPPNASYDVVTLVDICANIPGVQQIMPTGYLADENSNCQPDSCLNLAGLQISVPDYYDSDSNGNCTPHDECSNVSGIQASIPDNMLRGYANECLWDIVPLSLSEILPNAIGSDTGNEFIEVYNPTKRTVDLSIYSIKTGINSDKIYAFPVGSTIAPGEYRTFTDSTMRFTLLNTSSRVVLT